MTGDARLERRWRAPRTADSLAGRLLRAAGSALFILCLFAAQTGHAESASDLIKRGTKILEAGNQTEALALFDQARQKLPGWYLAHLYWGIAEAELRPESRAAVAAFERAVELAATNPRCHYHLGVAYNRVGRFAEAQKALRRAAELRPGLRDTQYQIGLAVRGQGRAEEAIAELEKARSLGPHHVPTLVALAALYERQRLLRSAELTLRYLATVDAERGEHGWAVVRLFERIAHDERAASEGEQLAAAGVPIPPEREALARGLRALDAGDLSTARAAFAEARALRADWFKTQLYWGAAEARLVPKSAAALAALERAAFVAPLNPLCHHHLGVARRRAGKTAAAEKSLRAAIALQPGIEDAQYHLGLALRDLGRRDQAIIELEKARTEKAAHPGTLVALAELFEQGRRFADAERALRELSSLPAGNSEQPLLLLEFLERVGAEEEATSERKRVEGLALELPPQRVLLWRGTEALLAGNLDGARGIFAQLRDQAPEWFMGHLYWAIAEAAITPDSGAALAALKRAVGLVPYNPRCHYQIGLIHLHAKRLPAAEASLRRAIELRPEIQDARFRLAVMLRDQRRTEEALAELEQARLENPDHLPTLAILAEIYEGAKRYAEAEEALRQITVLQPGVAYHHVRLAELLERTGQESKARRVRRQLERIDPRPKRRMRPLPPARR